MKTIYGVIADVLNTHDAVTRTALSGIANSYSDSVNRAFQQIAQLTRMPTFPFDKIVGVMDAHQAVTRQISAIVAGINFSAGTQIEKQIREAINLQTGFGELSELASQLTNLATISSGVNVGAVIASAIEEAERLEAEEADDVRNDIFAGYNGAEYLPERRVVESELAKIPEFDAMPAVAKFLQMLAIAAQSQSSNVQAMAMGMAGNLLAGILGQKNAGYWLICFLVIALVGKVAANLRVPRTRRILRSAQIDTRRTRIVGYPCKVTDQPKGRALRLGCLGRGTVVTITDKMKGWRQVCFVDSDDEQCFGWVRSKYLRKA